MAYKCPNCGGVAKRKAGQGRGAMMFGAIGALLAAAFTFRFNCPQCGDLQLSQMPRGTAGKVFLGTIALVLIAIGVAVAAIWLLIALSD